MKGHEDCFVISLNTFTLSLFLFETESKGVHSTPYLLQTLVKLLYFYNVDLDSNIIYDFPYIR